MKSVSVTAIVAVSMLLGGCGGYMANRQASELFAKGKTEEGLVKLQEAMAADNGNMEYRVTYIRRRAELINQYQSLGEGYRRAGRLSDAEKAYRKVLELDPGQSMARLGLDAVVMERRHKQSVAEAEGYFSKGGATNLNQTDEILRRVLAENPKQKDALTLKARLDDVRAKERMADVQLSAGFRKSISLEYRDAPLKSVFDLIAKISGLNFFFDKDIRPDLKATFVAKDISVEDAIRLLLVTNQLEQKVLNGNSILIFPNTPQKLKDYQSLSVRTFFLENADVKSVSTTIKTILKIKDLIVDERLGVIIMRDTPDAIRMAEKIVTLQDLPDPEVMLEVEILEVQRSRLQELGIQLPSQVTLTPLSSGKGPVTLDDLRHLSAATTQATVGSVVINARKEDSDINLLANPRIRVRNKEKAKILIGDKVPIITTTSTSTGFVAESVSYVDVGLKLEVEPNIYLDEEVAIKVNLEVSSLVKEITSKSGTLSYQIGTRNANTVLRLKDGETQVLAGLINDSDRQGANKVPLIGEIPLLGRLFGSQKNDVQRSEIVLSITPRLIRTIRRPDIMAAQFESGTEDSIGARAVTFSPVEDDVKPAAGTDAKRAASAAKATPPGTGGASRKAPTVGATPSAGAAPEAVPYSGEPPPAAALAPEADAAATPTPLRLAWQGSSQVKNGEQFSLVLNAVSQQGMHGMPLLISYDPASLQVVSVQEGEFFKQGNSATIFNQEVDPDQGKVVVATVREAAPATDGGANGSGNLVTLTFKATKPGQTQVQLVSVSPDPPGPTPSTMPVEAKVTVNP